MSKIEIATGFIAMVTFTTIGCASSGDTPTPSPGSPEASTPQDDAGEAAESGSFGDASQGCTTDADCPKGSTCQLSSHGEVGSGHCVPVDGGSADAAVPVASTELSAGAAHACAVTKGGALVCWGDNWAGALGDGTNMNQRTAPVKVSGLGSGVASVAAGGGFTCALETKGAASCWGDNQYGTVGDGTTTERDTPVAIPGLTSGVAAVSAGGANACALTSKGTVVCWGNNTYGALGNGADPAGNPPIGPTLYPTPAPVSGLSGGVSVIGAMNFAACAVQGAGGLLCWGENYLYGEVGDGTFVSRSTPTQVVGLSNGVAAIARGSYHTCAVTAGGALLCWGYNGQGQVGDGSTTTRTAPTQASGLASGIASVAVGGNHTCALTMAGAVLCWGDNTSGELGDGTTTQRQTPVPVSGLSSGVASIAAGYDFSCALTTIGGILCWGDNIQGQLGDGTTTTRLTPVHVTGF